MWTTSYPLPIDPRKTLKLDSFASTINIGSDIWTITETCYIDRDDYVLDIWKFNTATSQYQKIEFQRPEKFGDVFLSIKNVDNMIYMWRAYEEENMLFKFDTNTCTISYVLSIWPETHNITKVSEVIGNLMYVMEYEEEEGEEEEEEEKEIMAYLHTINLETEKVQSKDFLKCIVDTASLQLIVDNEQLYLYECVSRNDRTMYKINNGKLTVVSKDQLDNGKDGLHQTSDLTDHGILYLDKNGMERTVYCDTFDYKTRKWTRSLAEPWVHPYLLYNKGCCHINDKIYMLIDRSYTEEVLYDIRVFETVPRLESSCLMKVVKEYMENEDDQMVIRVMQLLPMTMRMQLDDMIRWRIEERRAKAIAQWEFEMMMKCLERIQMTEIEGIRL